MSILSWLKQLTRRRYDDDDLQEEIRSHLAMASTEKMADGADPIAARQASLREFGNVTLTREAAHGVWRPSWVEAFQNAARDVRYALRALAKNRGFALTVVAVLTLGIGLNAAVFTILKGMVLSPIAGVRDSSNLVMMYTVTDGGRRLRLSYPDFQALRTGTHAFADLFGSSYVTAGLGRGKTSRPLWIELVTGNYFQAMNVRAQLGRTLVASDETGPGQNPVIVLSDSIWHRAFNADPVIVGQTVEVNQQMLTVVGIAEPAFHGTIVSYDIDAFVPITMTSSLGLKWGSTSPDVLADRSARIIFPHGFLRPDATLAGARAEAETVWATVSRDRPLTDPAQQIKVVRFWQSITGAQTYLLPTLLVMTAMGLLVLIIACANIAGLVLVRGVSRRGEISVRLALGATRARIVRLLVVENLVLALPAAGLGMLLASYCVPLLVSNAQALAAPQTLFFNVEVDRLVLAFSVLVACGCALVFGFVPALTSSRVDLVAFMREVSPRGAARGRMRSGLVVAQVAVSMLLLVGSGLVTRSAQAARALPPGFDPAQVAVVDADLKQNAYDQPRGIVFYDRLLQETRADAIVESATLAAFTPLALLETASLRVQVEGYAPRKGEDVAFLFNSVGGDYFQTLRIPILAGRPLEDSDDATAAPVLVVNDTLARRFWGEPAKAIGRQIRITDGAWRTVVGVAADLKYLRVDEAPRPYMYLPFRQQYRSDLSLHVRGAGALDTLVDRARGHVTALDPELPVLSARPMTSAIRGAFLFFDLAAVSLFLFGVAGMALAALGTYGLVSYTVRQSTHEIGIRMALGAGRGAVVREFVRRGLRLGVIGSAIGLCAAVAAGAALRSALFGVSPTDAVSFGRALAVVMIGVVAATLIPAWRASKTDPLRALRHQ